MKYPIDFESLTQSVEFYHEVIQANKRANTYLESFEWCKDTKGRSLYLNLGSTLCIFLFEIENSASDEDNFLWVVVGDLPTMYLDIYGSKTTIEVLERYSGLARDWIFNVESGLSVDDCYPFDTAPTTEMADMLKKRIELIKKSIIPNIDEISLPPSLKSL